MSGHWEAEQYKEQLEASRTAHAACEAARREALVAIDRLRAELLTALEQRDIAQADYHRADDGWHEAEARLSAVIALCNAQDYIDYMEYRISGIVRIADVRSAATGDTR